MFGGVWVSILPLVCGQIILEQGRDGHFVEPEDRKMLLDPLTEAGSQTATMTGTMDGVMDAWKEKPGSSGGNQEPL